MPESGAPARADGTAAQCPSPDHADSLRSALTTCLSAWQHAHAWAGFMEPLSLVEATAAQAGHLALEHACALLARRITRLSERHPSPDEEQCAVLATWPSFARDWLDAPGDPRLGELLVDFLRHPMWPEPLTDDEAEHLRVLLRVESGAFGTASLLETLIEDFDGVADDNRTGEGLLGYGGLSGYARLGSSVPGDGLIVPEVRARIGAEDGQRDDPDTTTVVNEGSLDRTAQPESEIRDLLLEEAACIAASAADVVPLATSETAQAAVRRQAMLRLAEQVERFSGAAEILGLRGLFRVGRRFADNLYALAEGDGPMAPRAAELLVRMCSAIPDYLEQWTDGTTGHGLTWLLAHGAWPKPVDVGWAAEVDALLAHPVTAPQDSVARHGAPEPGPEDVSLALSHAVDRQLLEGLLLDLPAQIAALSTAIESLVRGGSLEDAEQAQRIAHTIKGAANTVGVVGLANLTHSLEDILLAIGRAGVAPGGELGQALSAAVDCLAAMGEAVLERAAPPGDPLAVLRTLMDWADKVRDEPVSAWGGTPLAAPSPEGRMITMPASFADDLLALAAEITALTAAIHERLGLGGEDTQQLGAQQQRVQQLARAIEDHLAPREEAATPRRVLTARSLVPALQRSVDDACEQTGKTARLRCTGADLAIDGDLLNRLRPALLHVLRNAVDHGIEMSAVRAHRGKDAAGQISVAFEREDGHLVIRCTDDGGGLDYDAIRATAGDGGILGADEQPSREELARLILMPGFSTRAQPTTLSGRGIGLDAVNQAVTALGGSVRVGSEPGRGCEVLLRVPLAAAPD